MSEIIHPLFRPAAARSAFSLIELIIVILIASLFAALVFSSVSSGKPREKKVGIRALKEVEDSRIGGEADLVCTDDCRTCRLVIEHKSHPVDSRLKPLTAYILDEGGSPQEIDFGRMGDEKVCLRFHYYPNGSTSQMILSSDETFYFIPSYFGTIETFDSLSAAAERWKHFRDRLDSMGAYY